VILVDPLDLWIEAGHVWGRLSRGKLESHVVPEPGRLQGILQQRRPVGQVGGFLPPLSL